MDWDLIKITWLSAVWGYMSHTTQLVIDSHLIFQIAVNAIAAIYMWMFLPYET